MAGDVKLDEGNSNWVTIEGTAIRARTSDLMLDSPARRGAGGGNFRRALVHDQRDGLTLNYNRDYPGGITLNAVAYISPQAPHTTGGLADRFRLRTVSELFIDGGIQFVWDNGPRVARVGAGAPSTEVVSLQGILADLQSQIADLQQRVAALEQP